MRNGGVIFVLGGARSGKSAFAERLAGDHPEPVYIATARVADSDSEMRARIDAHKKRRGAHWSSVEEPLELAETIARSDCPGGIVLVDCLTLWLANSMHAERDIQALEKTLTACLREIAGTVILVSNEIGLGIVPNNRLAREFRDYAGLLHQSVAATAQRVYFMIAGIPTTVKDTGNAS